MRHNASLTLLFFACLPLASVAWAGGLAADFASPPASARAGVWWRWIDGNITAEGITRDLHEMSREGIRGADIFDVAGAPQVGKVGMMSPEWRRMFGHAVEEAAANHISFGMVPAAGWGMGGPWIDAEHAAKTLRCAEVQVDGPQHLNQILPRPPGPANYYRDVAVVAFREPADRPVQPAEVRASSSQAGYCNERNWPPADVCDADPNTCWRSGVAVTPQSPAWLEFRYRQPLPASSLYLAGAPHAGPQHGELQALINGHFERLAAFDLKAGEARTLAFPPTTASVFRLLINSAYAPDVQLAEAWLLRAGDVPRLRPGIQWWWFKSAQRSFWDWPKQGPAALEEEYPEDGASDCQASAVVDLSSRLGPEGKLEWEVPAGRWTILRFGAVLLGEAPRMMSRALSGGYEPDPFAPVSADDMFQHTLGPLLQDAGPEAGKTLKTVLVDSWEYGATAEGFQPTWTDRFRQEFKRRRGYDLLPWLPALARRIVDSRQLTDRFLWDYRQTLAELYEDFYARLTQLAHDHHLQTRAENGYGTYPFQHIEGLAAFARVDVPMGEFWYDNPILTQHYHFADSVRTAASAAHIYGRRFVSAESLTIAHGIWEAPGQFKTCLDQAFCTGLNQSMLHLYSLQYDTNARPGLDTYDLLNANMTWWEQSHAFLDYISRCQALLQRGLPVADACYFYGEGACKFVPGRAFLQPALPEGYDFDGINAEVILHRLKARGGRLVLPDGMSYRYLVLPAQPGWNVSARVLGKLERLVRAGATIVGPPPGSAPGLTGFPRQDREVAHLRQTLWGATPGPTGVRQVGKGRVVWGSSMAQLLRSDAVLPDVQVQGGSHDLQWCHRREANTDIYFLSNQGETNLRVAVAFRVTGKQPELWDANSGRTRTLCQFQAGPGQTVVPLQFAPGQSWFVVFCKPVAQPDPSVANFPVLTQAAVVSGPWSVQFDPKWGGPEQPVMFEHLEDWSHRPEPSIKYYSGTAVYRKRFDLPAGLPCPGTRIFLDLGTVKDLTEVRLNGHDLGVLWTAPWQWEITDAVKPAGNELELRVVNLWPNRLIGDAHLPPGRRFTHTNVSQFSRDDQLLPSGLLGPVSLQKGR